LDVDLIIQSIHEGNTNDIAFTVTQPALKRAAVAAAITLLLRSHPARQHEAEVMVQRQIVRLALLGQE